MFWLWCVHLSIIKTDPRQILSCGIFYSILFGSTILSNLYLASMSIDRTVMILSPTRYHLIITRRHVLIRIFFILLIIIVFMIPHHFYYYYNPETTIFICEFYTFIDHWRIHIWSFFHAILFVSIPSLITWISSIILLHNRCHHRKRHRNKLSESARRMERNAILIFFFSMTIFFSILPYVILQIFIFHDRLFHPGKISTIRLKTYQILLNWFYILVAMNYSWKFYTSLIISKTFRKDFIYLFQRKEKNNEQNVIQINNQTLAKTIEI